VSETLIAIILGLVEGITEYLPVSSTGHLILFGDMLEFEGEKAKTFDVVIQLGAILSVVWLYRARFLELFKGLGSSMRDPASVLAPGMKGAAGICKLGLVTGPALVIGALFGSRIKEHLFNSTSVAIALAVGAVMILLVERFASFRGDADAESLTWKKSIVIGCVQCLALWPGMSRSASAIVGGMVVGLSRKAAAEFSFLAAVPILAAAAAHDLFKASATFSAEEMKLVAIGFGISFITALLTVKWFIGMVSRWSLRPFAYYRLVVAALVLLLL
jgi:undecaprenyl-diphosphatase